LFRFVSFCFLSFFLYLYFSLVVVVVVVVVVVSLFLFDTQLDLLDSVTPSSGPASGNTTVAINGTNMFTSLSDIESVFVGGVAASVLSVSIQPSVGHVTTNSLLVDNFALQAQPYSVRLTDCHSMMVYVEQAGLWLRSTTSSGVAHLIAQSDIIAYPIAASIRNGEGYVYVTTARWLMWLYRVLIAWDNYRSQFGWTITGQIVFANLTRLDTSFVISDGCQHSYESEPKIATYGTRAVVVVCATLCGHYAAHQMQWYTNSMCAGDSDGNGVVARVYDISPSYTLSASSLIGVNTFTPGDQSHPQVAAISATRSVGF